MNSNFVKDILKQIEEEDPQAFSLFSETHPNCFDKSKSDWLFPMLYNYYSIENHNERVISLLQQLGMKVHEKYISNPLNEIISIDKALCIDDSCVDRYVKRVLEAQNKNLSFKELNSPYKTIGISLALFEIPRLLFNSIIFEYKDYDHPYILADIASTFIHGNQLTNSINYLYRSARQIVNFPNKFWNSEYGIVGAANTLRLLQLMCPVEITEIFSKIFKYNFLYLTKLSCTAKDPTFEQGAYINRASIVRNPRVFHSFPLGFNPDLLYISDLYYAHFCNPIAESSSNTSGWNYYMKSLTFYQHGDIRPNGSGGYVEKEDRTYGEIVSQKHLQAIDIALAFFNEIQSGSAALKDDDIDCLFKEIYHECKYNYKEIRNRVLNYKTY